MVKKVIKKGGKIEPFYPDKIRKSLSGLFDSLKISPEKKTEIIDKVFQEVVDFLKDKKEISTAEIEAKILLELENILPEAARNWREYRIRKRKGETN